VPAIARAPVSVVIRNRNEARALRRVLHALSVQSSLPGEIIVVDNESTDDSIEVARKYGAHVVHLARHAFTYGKALNLGIATSTQPFVIALSAHSVPLGRNFIEDILEPFKDPMVAAVNCRNVARRDLLADWPTPTRLTGDVRWETLFTDGLINRSAAIRRDCWSEFPFNESLGSSEDTLWSRQVLEAGYSIVTGSAMYVYVLDRGLVAGLKKRDKEALANYQITGIRPPYSPLRLMRAFFVRGPRAAGRLIARECLLFASSLSLPLRAGGQSRFRSAKIPTVMRPD
jgi:rhamnosyltransferase